MRRAVATLSTLGMLFSFLLAVVLGLMLFGGAVSLPIAVAVVIVTNVVILLVSPWFNDLLYRWLYDVEWIAPERFRNRSPASMAVIEEVTNEYGYETPKLGIIPDRNPTAFTYGSGRYNARIVVTEGCFEYLNDEELASVVAHELGHITSRDFITMTLANTIVQILYLIAVNAMEIAQASSASASSPSSSGRRGNPAQALAIVGIVAYVLWFVSEYAVLYLSRAREYAADAFAPKYTDPDDLSTTHPLTGKRIRALSSLTPTSRFDFTDIRERFPVDRGRLYREFARDVAVLALPFLLAVGFPVAYLAAAVFDLFGVSLSGFVGGWLIAVGIALLVGAFYRYPTGEPEETTVLELLTDVYASPVDGDRVHLTGELIGRGTAGYRFSEDLMFQDATGLMYLKYDSWLPVLGDLLFSVREVPDLIGESVTVEGWFFRATSPWMGLRRLRIGDRTIGGFVHLGSFVGAGLAILLGVVVFAAPFVL